MNRFAFVLLSPALASRSMLSDKTALLGGAKIRHLHLWLVLAAILSGCFGASADDARKFRFDSVCPMVHDPVMAHENGRFYIFSTGMGLDLMSSDDMKTWRREPSPLVPFPQWAQKPVPAYKGHTWAPDIVRRNGQWYLYYSCSTFGKNISAIGVAVNKTLDPASPDYCWNDLGQVVSSVPGRDDWNAIDPNVVFDTDGNPWLTFGSFWDGIQLVALDSDMKTPVAPQTTIARRVSPSARPASANAIEAPFIVYRQGWYYLFVSHDYCCKGLRSDYKTVVGRSRKITGPYLDRDGRDMADGGGTLLVGPNPLYSGVGHCSVYEVDGRWYFLAHGYDRSRKGSSRLFLRELTWSDGWPQLRVVP